MRKLLNDFVVDRLGEVLTLLVYSQSNLGFSRADEAPVIVAKNVYCIDKLILMLKKDNLNWRIDIREEHHQSSV